MELWIVLLIAVCVIMSPIIAITAVMMRRNPAMKAAFFAALAVEGLLLAAIIVWQFGFGGGGG